MSERQLFNSNIYSNSCKVQFFSKAGKITFLVSQSKEPALQQSCHPTNWACSWANWDKTNYQNKLPLFCWLLVKPFLKAFSSRSWATSTVMWGFGFSLDVAPEKEEMNAKSPQVRVCRLCCLLSAGHKDHINTSPSCFPLAEWLLLSIRPGTSTHPHSQVMVSRFSYFSVTWLWQSSELLDFAGCFTSTLPVGWRCADLIWLRANAFSWPAEPLQLQVLISSQEIAPEPVIIIIPIWREFYFLNISAPKVFRLIYCWHFGKH